MAHSARFLTSHTPMQMCFTFPRAFFGSPVAPEARSEEYFVTTMRMPSVVLCVTDVRTLLGQGVAGCAEQILSWQAAIPQEVTHHFDPYNIVYVPMYVDLRCCARLYRVPTQDSQFSFSSSSRGAGSANVISGFDHKLSLRHQLRHNWPHITWNNVRDCEERSSRVFGLEFEEQVTQAHEVCKVHPTWAGLREEQRHTLREMVAHSLADRDLRGCGGISLMSCSTGSFDSFFEPRGVGHAVFGRVGCGKTLLGTAFALVMMSRSVRARPIPAQDGDVLVVAPLSCLPFWRETFAAQLRRLSPPSEDREEEEEENKEGKKGEREREYASSCFVTFMTPQKLQADIAAIRSATTMVRTFSAKFHLVFEAGIAYVVPSASAPAYATAQIVLTSDPFTHDGANTFDLNLVAGQEVLVTNVSTSVYTKAHRWVRKVYRAYMREDVSVRIAITPQERDGGDTPESSPREYSLETIDVFEHDPYPRYTTVIVDEAHQLSRAQAVAASKVLCESCVTLTASPLGKDVNVAEINSEIAIPRKHQDALSQILDVANAPGLFHMSSSSSSGQETERERGGSTTGLEDGESFELRVRRVDIDGRAAHAALCRLREQTENLNAIIFNRVLALESLVWSHEAQRLESADALARLLVSAPACNPVRKPKRRVVESSEVFGLDMCPLCLSSPQEAPVAFLPCRHTMCASCATEFLDLHVSSRCPVCRTIVSGQANIRWAEEKKKESVAAAAAAAAGAAAAAAAAYAGGADERLAWLVEYLVTQPVEKVVVFSNFKFNVGQIIHYVRTAAPTVGCVSITGETSEKQRATAIDVFSRDANVRVMAVTYRTCATGLNLQASHTAVFFELPADATVMHQAVGRIARMGQVSPVVNLISFKRASPFSMEHELDLRLRDDLGRVTLATTQIRRNVIEQLREHLRS